MPGYFQDWNHEHIFIQLPIFIPISVLNKLPYKEDEERASFAQILQMRKVVLEILLWHFKDKTRIVRTVHERFVHGETK